uniref:Uncharacterized protein n=1 Tax=Catharus ustulatus TaxID=91951 RepID=A0A8C3VD19_CATUS
TPKHCYLKGGEEGVQVRVGSEKFTETSPKASPCWQPSASEGTQDLQELQGVPHPGQGCWGQAGFAPYLCKTP